ncbi:MAG: chlorophyll synthase ChlG [Pseudomonadota bacterium]
MSRMDATPVAPLTSTGPTPGAVLALLKPITWFPPMWAYGCGVVATPTDDPSRWGYIIGGIVLAGPLVCGTSQAVNDWFDRHVDAINEPTRVIPSGRMPGRSALHVAVAGTVLSAGVAALLGPWVLVAALIALVLAWAYSAPPLRLKQNGWGGNAAVGFSYETLPWLTAAAAVAGTLPPTETLTIALLYGAGAHGILTLNDFKAIEGDRRMGVASLPVQLGVQGAARLSGLVMIVPQLLVVFCLGLWEKPIFAASIFALIVIQAGCLRRMLRDPRKYAVWYSGVGVGLYVIGMMIAAVALRGLHAASL